MEIKFPNTDKIESQPFIQLLYKKENTKGEYKVLPEVKQLSTISVRHIKNLGTQKISLVLLSHAMMSRPSLTK